MTTSSLPLTLKPSGLPVKQFIECTRCLDASRDESAVDAWAAEHLTKRPGHDTFRTVNTASWRLGPKEHTTSPTT